jgi:hypothetical protein
LGPYDVNTLPESNPDYNVNSAYGTKPNTARLEFPIDLSLVNFLVSIFACGI